MIFSVKPILQYRQNKKKITAYNDCT
jgi:hypothetical protein